MRLLAPRFLWGEHETDTGAVEKGQARGRPEEQRYAQDIAVEGRGAVDILDDDQDLVDSAETERLVRHGNLHYVS
ncbi:MAG TPA: hypothetical protein VGA42_04345 [Gemmatimonadales bacterium]